MKINKKSNKKVIVAVTIILVIIIGGGAFAVSQGFFSKQPVKNTTNNSSSNKNTANDDNDTNKTDDNDQSSAGTTNTTEPDKTTPQTDDPNTKNGTMEVSGVAFKSVDNLSVQNITIYSRDASGNYRFLSGGTCTLTVGNYTASQAIDPTHTGSNYTACDNFIVPISQISGNTFTIKVRSSQGQTATFTGNIQ